MQRIVWECDKCGAEAYQIVRLGTKYMKRDRSNIPDKWAWVTISEDDHTDPDDEEEEDEAPEIKQLLFCMTCKLNLTDKIKPQDRHVQQKRARKLAEIDEDE
jgi:hypothetical protein